MTNKIKLTSKQSNILNQIQQQKQQLQESFKELNQKESLVIELVLEMANIDADLIDTIKLENDVIIYTEKLKQPTEDIIDINSEVIK